MKQALSLLLLVACGEPAQVRVPVTVSHGQALIDVVADGQTGRCIIDTASDVFFVSERMAEGRWPWESYVVNRVDYGETGQRFVPTVVLPGDVLASYGAPFEGGIDCLLGYPALPDAGLLDYAGDALVAYPQDALESAVFEAHQDLPVALRGPVPAGRVDFGDVQDVAMVIATGPGNSLVRPFIYEQLQMSVQTEQVDVATENGTERLLAALVPVSGAGVAGLEEWFLVYDSPYLRSLDTVASESIDGMLGTRFLLQHGVHWDRRDDTLTLHRYTEQVRERLLELYGEDWVVQ